MGAHFLGLCRALGAFAWERLADAAGDLRDAAALGPREFFRRAGVLVARLAGWAAATTLGFVLVGAVVAAHFTSGFARVSLAMLALFPVPLALVWLTPLGRRRGVATAWSCLVIVSVVGGGGHATGGAMRRHGDWFLGQRTDSAAAVWRGAIAGTGALIEWFTPPPALRSHELPIEEAPRFYGPWQEGETPPPPEPVAVRWFHPLARRRAHAAGVRVAPLRRRAPAAAPVRVRARPLRRRSGGARSASWCSPSPTASSSASSATRPPAATRAASCAWPIATARS